MANSVVFKCTYNDGDSGQYVGWCAGGILDSPSGHSVIHLPQAFPWKTEFQKVALALGATAG